ncbi:hypothetical protein GGR56DRAFT_139621 [Xylariaceae sp. FL0804]|nr:hypothetical protein GGR56DRAFT_139621 [Xylariaceae sp. FL0804]
MASLRFGLRRPIAHHRAKLTLGLRPGGSRPIFTWRETTELGIPLWPVPVLRPVAWALSAAGLIYFGCAAWAVRHDVDDWKRNRWGGRRRRQDAKPETFEDLERPAWSGSSRTRYENVLFDATGLGELAEFDEPSQLAVSAVVANGAVLALSRLAPTLGGRHFLHVPVAGANYTLLTSNFGHAGPLHLALNMYVLYDYGRKVAGAPTFRDTGVIPHLTAFYLASGVLAALGQHLATVWPHRAGRYGGSLGASGAVSALVGAFLASYPDARMSVIALPVSLPASGFLVGWALFEAVGIFVRYPVVRLAHAAHLTGLAVGAAYVHFDARRTLWRPTRRLAFNTMRRLDLI